MGIASTGVGSRLCFGSEFWVVFVKKKNLGNFGKMCFSSVISTNLAISREEILLKF